jgi:hypothetical protein
MGMPSLANVRMTSLDKPASRGEHGPGDTKMRSGLSARICSIVI